jgi:hypothetical protein
MRNQRTKNRDKLEEAIHMLEVHNHVYEAVILLKSILLDNPVSSKDVSTKDGDKLTEDEKKKNLVTITAVVVGETSKCYFIKTPLGHKSVPLARSKVHMREDDNERRVSTFVIPTWLSDKLNDSLTS